MKYVPNTLISLKNNFIRFRMWVYTKNPFKSGETFGLDLFDDQSLNIKYCRLGFDKMPFADNHFDFITVPSNRAHT